MTLRASAGQFKDAREVQNIHFALDAHREINGRFPRELDTLVEANLLEQDHIVDRFGNAYAYMYIPAEDRYVLSP